MAIWLYKLNLVDVFHNDDMSLEQRRDEIVKRIKVAPFWDENDIDLVETVDELAETNTVDYFDDVWDGFYDWANTNRVWVETL